MSVTFPHAQRHPVDRGQIILLGNRGTTVWTTCPESLLPDRESNPRPLDHKFNAQPTAATHRSRPTGYLRLLQQRLCFLSWPPSNSFLPSHREATPLITSEGSKRWRRLLEVISEATAYIAGIGFGAFWGWDTKTLKITVIHWSLINLCLISPSRVRITQVCRRIPEWSWRVWNLGGIRVNLTPDNAFTFTSYSPH